MTYSKNLTSYRALQDEIAILTAKALGVDLAREDLNRIGRRGTDNIEAYGLYLEGTTLIERQKNADDIRNAIAKFLRAIAVDPGYALAYWGAGNAYENLYYAPSTVKDPVALEKMYEYFSKASNLDPTFPETNLGLGWYYFNKGDNSRAFESFRKALELEPDGTIVNRDAGAFLKSIGLYKQAIPYLSRAAKLSPRDPLPLIQLAQSWLYLGQCEKALRYTERAIAIEGSDPDAGIMHALLLALTGRLDEADREIEAVSRLGLRADRLPFLRDLATALRGSRKPADSFPGERPTVAPQGTYAYLLLGMKDEAVANIQAGIDQGLWHGQYLYAYPSLAENPRLKGLRDDPRFQAILARQKEIYLRELKALEKL
jgi:adenylate cyclase